MLKLLIFEKISSRNCFLPQIKSSKKQNCRLHRRCNVHLKNAHVLFILFRSPLEDFYTRWAFTEANYLLFFLKVEQITFTDIICQICVLSKQNAENVTKTTKLIQGNITNYQFSHG